MHDVIHLLEQKRAQARQGGGPKRVAASVAARRLLDLFH